MNQTNTHNVNKTRDLLQTSGGKDERNINTQNVKTHKRKTQKIKKMNNTDPAKKTGV